MGRLGAQEKHSAVAEADTGDSDRRRDVMSARRRLGWPEGRASGLRQKPLIVQASTHGGALPAQSRLVRNPHLSDAGAEVKQFPGRSTLALLTPNQAMNDYTFVKRTKVRISHKAQSELTDFRTFERGSTLWNRSNRRPLEEEK
jgi:hypothetical protein